MGCTMTNDRIVQHPNLCYDESIETTCIEERKNDNIIKK